MKKSSARRDEILAVAERLFYTKGYEGTSVQDILDEMSFSKGGFYHHFDSKLAVLEAICAKRAQENGENAKAMCAQLTSAVDKLNALLHASTLLSRDNTGFAALLIGVAYREDGALMREKMRKTLLECVLPIAVQVVADGAASGEFFVDNVQDTAQMILRLHMQFTDEIAFLIAREENEEQMAEDMVRKLSVYRTAVERMLIAPFGSMNFVDAKELRLLGQGVLRERVRQRADAMLGS